ncbi:hypothetical protein MATL_G00052910 [Megalops atlanticus]|uniref:Phosphotransferase n=1 Tax=Megalops atlanticus TaxID=7932 RepID=A0A9D3QCU7_MEGAT|nr:hypothetical protein MATL_G00052910 [Megalops atlanticus]
MSSTETDDFNGSPGAGGITLSQDVQGQNETLSVTLKKVEDFLQPFRLSMEKLREVSARLRKDFIRGLSKRRHSRPPVKMLPTFVRSTPDGTERGDFLALDLGGTNLRVFHVRVEDQENVRIVNRKTDPIPTEKKKGTGNQLFDFIAASLADFLKSSSLTDQTLPLGFTFSFPCDQKDIDKCILVRWTKGFDCSGVEGEDVVKLLWEAIKRNKPHPLPALSSNISSIDMVNDTVGTMMSCAFQDQSCEIGMIVGTGTNACYMEEMKNVKRMEGEDGRMCINTEWGGFGDNGSLRDIQTEFDLELDRGSPNQGENQFEKMISGMYLGEVVRLVLVKLAQEKLLFGGELSEDLLTQDKFKTKYISQIEEDTTGLEQAWEILLKLGLPASPEDCEIVRMVCSTISTRSAHLCAAALATIVNRIRTNRGLDHLRTTVGVDGTVYKKHPKFSQRLRDAVRILAPKCEISFLDSEDDSGKGAAMVTAVVPRQPKGSWLLEDSDGEGEDEEEEEEEEEKEN